MTSPEPDYAKRRDEGFRCPPASIPRAAPRPADPDRLSASCQDVRAGRGLRRRRSASCSRPICVFRSAHQPIDDHSRRHRRGGGGETPRIVAMWHGQHLMISFAWPNAINRMAALISRHEDAGAQASALNARRHAGARLGRPSRPRHYKGGAPAMRELMRQLKSGALVAMTADVPKRARIAGHGIVTLARLSGCPTS